VVALPPSWKNAFDHHLKKSTTAPLEKALPAPMLRYIAQYQLKLNGIGEKYHC